RLRYTAPPSAMTPELRDALASRKGELLKVLTDRAARVRLVEERTLAALAETPAGPGRWAGAWERVEAASSEYLAALADLERSGTPEAEEAAKRAANALVLAWRRAAAAWESAGRPVTWPAEAEGEAP